MSDDRRGPSSAWPPAEEPPPSLAELVEVAVRRLMTAIVIGGGLIALAVYSKADPPRYQVTAADGRLFRVNTESGTVIACENARCAIVLERGQDPRGRAAGAGAARTATGAGRPARPDRVPCPCRRRRRAEQRSRAAPASR